MASKFTREFGSLRTNDLQNASKSQNKTAAVCLVRVLALLSGGVKFQLNERKFTNLRLRQRKEMRVV